MSFPIDIVFTWVDGSDPQWQRKEREFRKCSDGEDSKKRFRDYGLLKNAIARVWRFAPWVHRVYLITDNQAPEWAKQDERIVTIDHTDFIPSNFLPTFNSNCIEMNIWRISSLQEHFVLFNDDIFLTQAVTPDDFFDRQGLPILNGGMHIIQPKNDFSRIVFNNMVVVNELYPKWKFFRGTFSKHFNLNYGVRGNLRGVLAAPYNVWTGFFEDHLACPHLKSWFATLYSEKPSVFEETSSHRFRQPDDYSHWLIKNLYIASGEFSPRRKNFGVQYGLKSESQLPEIGRIMTKQKMIVLNDELSDEAALHMLPDLKQVLEMI
ncbi:stealth family protein [Lacticaseibacillus paracasei]|uniref:Sugar phosphotransferase n=1 Tax=Lacticaseibacillus paracasei TaxID=1597 RepID=A0ABD7BWC1_LACPA|nr:Stealth CR1 domain-containing protein [Lacticaseibacillus paracasei]QOP57025.1 sugar phosphotransferase [Lacticaseibacillus paracasei]